MPEISRFYGLVIKMIFNDNDKHHKPHVHVYYWEYEASVGLDGEGAGWKHSCKTVSNAGRLDGHS